MKKEMSLVRVIILGLALVVAPAVLLTSCWEDLDEVLGMRGGIEEIDLELTVIYDGNGNLGGIVPEDSTVYSPGQTVSVAANTGNLTRIPVAGTAEAFKFGGWNTKANGAGDTYVTGVGTFVITKDMILYAKWIPFVLRDVGPAGGWVFHDKGVFSENWRYLEAAPVETEWTNVQWGGYNHVIGATGVIVGTGKSNTLLIVSILSGLGETNKAAQLCASLNYVDYDDWFLPSRDEQDLIYENLHTFGVGGFLAGVVDIYWSSTEVSATFGRNRRFVLGGEGSGDKRGDLRVRAVRAF